jgi:large subunit ribosomal protein L10
MPNAEKLEKVAVLKERIRGSSALLLAEYRGLTVHDATELRRALSGTARFSVVKNTLMQRAAGEAGIQELETFLSGPTAVAFVEGDVVAAAKKVVEAAKKFPTLVLKGAYLDGKVLDAAQAQSLATLESREVMLSKIAGMLKSEMTRAASMFQTLQARFLGVLEAYRDKLPGSAEAEPSGQAEPPAEPEPPAEVEPSAEAEPSAEVATEGPADEVPVEDQSGTEDADTGDGPEPAETSEAESSATDEEE